MIWCTTLTMTPVAPDDKMLEAIRASIPSLKTQAQFTAFTLGFDALRLTFDAIFSQNESREKQALATLEQAFDVARKSTDLAKKFEEVPSESRGPASNPFTSPPSEFHEYDTQKRLMLELESINTLSTLTEWYETNKADRDRIVTQSLRNILIDAIRQKRLSIDQAVT